jgi:hypothetical protein
MSSREIKKIPSNKLARRTQRICLQHGLHLAVFRGEFLRK